MKRKVRYLRHLEKRKKKKEGGAQATSQPETPKLSNHTKRRVDYVTKKKNWRGKGEGRKAMLDHRGGLKEGASAQALP